MNIYLGGASREAKIVRFWMEKLREAGHVITHDWLANIARVGAANEGVPDDARRRASLANEKGIFESDLTWILAPSNESTGAWVELGIVRGLAMVSEQARLRMAGCPTLGCECAPIHAPKLIISGPARVRSIFASLGTEFDSDAEAFEYINTKWPAKPKAT